MSECGKRVGKSVVVYPCQVDAGADGSHDGPCAAPENSLSLRQREAWLREVQTTVLSVEEEVDEGIEVLPIDAETDVVEGYVLSGRGKTVLTGQLQAEKAADRGGQPVPVHQEGSPSMHDLLIAEVEKRKALGLSRYGTILQAGNGRDALQDLLDEMIDGCVYLMQLLAERDTTE